MRKPILCLDFDGVCHSYTSGWKGADDIPDLPVVGLFEFLHQAVNRFELHVFSSRSHHPNGISAMQGWFRWHHTKWKQENNRPDAPELPLIFPLEKPPASITLDDRALTFTGVWPNMQTLVEFQPWMKRQLDVFSNGKHYKNVKTVADMIRELQRLPGDMKVAYDMPGGEHNDGLDLIVYNRGEEGTEHLGVDEGGFWDAGAFSYAEER